MKKESIIDDIIYESLNEINLLLPKNKKIKKNNFKILDNPHFDSLNYVTFILSIEKKVKKNLKKNIDLINTEKTFKNKAQLLNHILTYL